MVNLLFISNSAKMDGVKCTLQPLLKVKIDIVSDFDFGLKDVFEKRPAMVFIQDQIAGVTGESVARHIQMLLGSSAPSFVFMHDGTSKAKPIKGLYEYLVDFSQNEVKLVDDIQAILKSILGPQWEKIYIPPLPRSSDILSADNLPVENRTVADLLVDDLLSELEKPGATGADTEPFTHAFSSHETIPEEPMIIVSSEQEQLAEILAESARKPVEAQAEAEMVPQTGNAEAAVVSKPQRNAKQRPPKTEITSKPLENAEQSQSDVTINDVSPAPHSVETDSVQKDTTTEAAGDAGGESVSSTIKRTQQPSSVSPAEFRIGGDGPAIESIPNDLLLAFEDNYHQQMRARKRNVIIAAALLLLLGTVFYLYKQKPHLIAALKKQSQPVQVAVKPSNSSPNEMPVLKPVSSLRASRPASLPSFIPQSGVDSSFASSNPGWERYLGPSLEYRVFRSDNRIRAIQVLALKGHSIKTTTLKSVLTELTGNSDYRVTSSEQRTGYLVARAKLNAGSDLLIYRSKSDIRAFVVSLD